MHTVTKPVLVVPDYRWQLLRSPPGSALLFFRRMGAKLLGLVGAPVGKRSAGSSPEVDQNYAVHPWQRPPR
jgi:hypothetical protein